MTAERPSRLFGALVLGAFTSIVVAFVGGCIFALALSRDPHTGAISWPRSGVDVNLLMGTAGLFGLFATPIAVLLGTAVALPLFRYWAQPRRASTSRLLGAAMALSVAA